ncbi:zinc-binding dehydrogenase [Paraburkholderia sp. CNPSo 3274]|nr:zinc-binding dehydrogenase [Paraburkholderia sp. CNPSo 3274]MCP3707060.1 zinc-binding dehydrogenase [Paraburkholderia sp. CNPSo 3274]
MTFKALLATKPRDAISTRIVNMREQDLMPGDVTIAVEYPTVNFKDALAISGRAEIIREFPLIAGIDLAGTVEASTYPGICAGDRVVLNGWELSQNHHGGFAQKARVKGEWLVKLPEVLSTHDAMPTEASGSIAIAVLSGLGYRVVASTGRPAEADYLHSLGAAEVIDRRTLSEPGTPLARERWAGAVDSVGHHTLANVLAQMQYRGVVAACGLAQGSGLPGSVMPFSPRNTPEFRSLQCLQFLPRPTSAKHHRSMHARFSRRSPGFAAVWSPSVSRASPTRRSFPR